jgi:hypothetical protein
MDVSVKFTELDTWLGISGIRQSIEGTQETEDGRFMPTAVDIHFDPPPPIELPLDGGEAIRMSFGFSSSGLDPLAVRAEIAQSVTLFLRFPDARPFDDIPKAVSKLRNFLSLAVGTPVTVLSVVGYKDEFRHPQVNTREPIELLWQIPHNPPISERKLHPSEMLSATAMVIPTWRLYCASGSTGRRSLSRFSISTFRWCSTPTSMQRFVSCSTHKRLRHMIFGDAIHMNFREPSIECEREKY